MAELTVGDRIDEQLEPQSRPALGVGPQGGGRRQVATGAVATDRQPASVAAVVGRVGFGPSQGGHAVVEGGRVRVLWSEPIVDVHHHGPELVRHDPAQRVGLGGRADHPTAAVHPHEDGKRRRRAGHVHQHGHAVGVPLLEAGDLRAGRGHPGEGGHGLAGRHRVELVERRRAKGGQLVEQYLGLGVERHAANLGAW